MRTLNSFASGLAVCAVCMSGASDAAGILQRGGWVTAPRMSSELIRRDMVIETLRIEVECGGIAGLDMLPDGWTVSVESHGEDTVAVVSKAPGIPSRLSAEDAKAQVSYLDEFRFRLLARGEWSDCMSARFTVEMQPRQRVFAMPGGGTRRSFRSGDFDRWIPVDERDHRP